MATPEWTHYHEKKRKSVTRLKDRESFIFNFHNKHRNKTVIPVRPNRRYLSFLPGQ